MADNVDVTPGVGATIATDDVGGAQYQRVKLDIGGNGVSSPVIAGNPLPVANDTATAWAAVTAAKTDTSDTAIKASAGASLRNYITSLTVTNSHATVGTVVEVKDGSTVIHRGYAAPAGGGYVVTFPTPLKGTAATEINVANITTGSNTYVSMSGYTGA